MIQMQNNKPVCTENILHITSGEMTANALRELLPQEEILPFNEAMCEGEVHIEIFKDEFYRLRAAARVLAVVLEAAAAVGQVREAAAVFR